MTYKQKYDNTKHWLQRISIMFMFHTSMQNKDDTWTMRKTSKYFDVCIGLVSENLALAQHIDDIKQFEFRKDALLWLKRNK